MIRRPPRSTLFPSTPLSQSSWRGTPGLRHSKRGRASVTAPPATVMRDRKSTRLNSSHSQISYAVFCLKKKTAAEQQPFPSPRHETDGYGYSFDARDRNASTV